MTFAPCLDVYVLQLPINMIRFNFKESQKTLMLMDFLKKKQHTLMFQKMQIVQIEEFKLSKKTRVGIIPFVHRFEVRILFCLFSICSNLFSYKTTKSTNSLGRLPSKFANKGISLEEYSLICCSTGRSQYGLLSAFISMCRNLQSKPKPSSKEQKEERI